MPPIRGKPRVSKQPDVRGFFGLGPIAAPRLPSTPKAAYAPKPSPFTIVTNSRSLKDNSTTPEEALNTTQKTSPHQLLQTSLVPAPLDLTSDQDNYKENDAQHTDQTLTISDTTPRKS